MGEIDIRFLLCFLEERYIGGGAAVVQTPQKKRSSGWVIGLLCCLHPDARQGYLPLGSSMLIF
jgi:hypothetical protein